MEKRHRRRDEAFDDGGGGDDGDDYDDGDVSDGGGQWYDGRRARAAPPKSRSAPAASGAKKSRQRSCGPCALKKRPCDHQQPCSRCIDLNIVDKCVVLKDRRRLDGAGLGLRGKNTAAFAAAMLGDLQPAVDRRGGGGGGSSGGGDRSAGDSDVGDRSGGDGGGGGYDAVDSSRAGGSVVGAKRPRFGRSADDEAAAPRGSAAAAVPQRPPYAEAATARAAAATDDDTGAARALVEQRPWRRAAFTAPARDRASSRVGGPTTTTATADADGAFDRHLHDGDDGGDDGDDGGRAEVFAFRAPAPLVMRHVGATVSDVPSLPPAHAIAALPPVALGGPAASGGSSGGGFYTGGGGGGVVADFNDGPPLVRSDSLRGAVARGEVFLAWPPSGSAAAAPPRGSGSGSGGGGGDGARHVGALPPPPPPIEPRHSSSRRGAFAANGPAASVQQYAGGRALAPPSLVSAEDWTTIGAARAPPDVLRADSLGRAGGAHHFHRGFAMQLGGESLDGSEAPVGHAESLGGAPGDAAGGPGSTTSGGIVRSTMADALRAASDGAAVLLRFASEAMIRASSFGGGGAGGGGGGGDGGSAPQSQSQSQSLPQLPASQRSRRRSLDSVGASRFATHPAGDVDGGGDGDGGAMTPPT